jgi:hypothetical protein
MGDDAGRRCVGQTARRHQTRNHPAARQCFRHVLTRRVWRNARHAINGVWRQYIGNRQIGETPIRPLSKRLCRHKIALRQPSDNLAIIAQHRQPSIAAADQQVAHMRQRLGLIDSANGTSHQRLWRLSIYSSSQIR